jgi:hypothetical protein
MKVGAKRVQQLGFLFVLFVVTISFLFLWNPLLVSDRVSSQFFSTAYDDVLDFSLAEGEVPISSSSIYIAVSILSDPDDFIPETHKSWGEEFLLADGEGTLTYLIDSPCSDSTKLYPIITVQQPIYPLNTTRLCRMELAAIQHFLSATTASWILVVHERTWVNYTAVTETLNFTSHAAARPLFVAAADSIREATVPHKDGGWAISRGFARKILADGPRWLKKCTDETTRGEQVLELVTRFRAQTTWTPDFIGIEFNDEELEGLLVKNFSRIDICKLPLISTNEQTKGINGNFLRSMNHVGIWSLPSHKFFLKLPAIIPHITHLGYSYIDGQGNICKFR